MARPKNAKTTQAFADDVVEALIERTEKGEPLIVICAEANMPKRRTVYEWIEADPEFAARFRAARARGVHALAEDCLAIADEKTTDAVAVANKRVRIDTRLRLAGKWLPSIYGDRVDVNHSGEIVNRHDLSGLSPDELDALEKLVGKASDRPGDSSGEVQAVAGSVH